MIGDGAYGNNLRFGDEVSGGAAMHSYKSPYYDHS